MGKKWALLIGNESYHYWVELGKSVANINALGQSLLSPYIGAFDEVQILVDGSVEEIKKAIQTFVSGKKPEDLLFLYLTGHGVCSDRGQWFFVCDKTPNPMGSELSDKILEATAVSAQFIREHLDVSYTRVKSQVIILDTCYAGAFAGMMGQAKRNQHVGKQIQGASSSGRIILAATGSERGATEGPIYFPTSLFTYYLVQGLITGAADRNKTGWITADDWFTHVSEYVQKEELYQQPRKDAVAVGGRPIIVARNPSLVHNPNDAYEQHNRAYILSTLREDEKEISRGFESALKVYNGALQVIAPYNAVAWLHKGNILFHLQRYEEALKVYKAVVGLDSNNAIAWHNLGCALFQLHQYTEALSPYEKARMLDPNEPEIWYNLGCAYFHLGRNTEAFRAFDMAKQIDPTNPKIWAKLGFVLSHLGHSDSDNALATAKALNIPGELIRYSEGLILERYFWNKEIFDVLRTAPLLASDGWKAVNRYHHTHGYDDSKAPQDQLIFLLEDVLREAPSDDPTKWHHRGSAFVELGRYEEALFAYKEAIKHAPADAHIRYGESSFSARIEFEKGYALLKLRRYEEAYLAFQASLKLSPLENIIVDRDGREFVPTNDPHIWIDKAQQRADGSVEIGDAILWTAGNPREFIANVWLNSGCASFKLGRYKEALQAFQYACGLSSDKDLLADAHNYKADALQQLGRHEEAQQAYDQANMYRY